MHMKYILVKDINLFMAFLNVFLNKAERFEATIRDEFLS